MVDICLNCTLPICDESLPGCAFVQIRRPYRRGPGRRSSAAGVRANSRLHSPRPSRPVPQPRPDLRTPKRDRRDYWREYKRRRKANPAMSYTDAQIKRDLLAIMLKI